MNLLPPSSERIAMLAALLLVVVGVVSGCGKSPSADTAASKPKTNSVVTATKTNAPAISTNTVDMTLEFKSVFDDKLKEGRDPFYPLSPRVHQQPQTNAVVNNVPLPTDFVLKGISGGRGRYFALINGTTFMENQERAVLSRGRTVRVFCVKITESSATIRIENNPLPLELRFSEKRLTP